jgi:ectoine hydroxylase-related dioxygenase (phytanoyl-CoA dioxygenase family)
MTKGDWKQTQPAKLHRDDHGFKMAPGFRNPFNDYQTSSGEIYCSHVATWVALAPVPRNTGFSVIPGSHKAEFALPDFLQPVPTPSTPGGCFNQAVSQSTENQVTTSRLTLFNPTLAYAPEQVHDQLSPDGAPMTVTIPLEPGDAVVFSTNLYHDAAAWTEDHARVR